MKRKQISAVLLTVLTLLLLAVCVQSQTVQVESLEIVIEDDSTETAYTEEETDISSQTGELTLLTRVVTSYPDGTSYLQKENEYDTEGNLIRETSYNGGKIDNIYEYDLSGHMVKRRHYDGEGHLVWWAEWEYDADDNLARDLTHYDNGNVEGQGWEYDADGNEIRMFEYEPDGSIGNWGESEYDADGNLIKIVHYSWTGEIIWGKKWEYDADGNPIRMFHINEEGLPDHRSWTEYEYISL